MCLPPSQKFCRVCVRERQSCRNDSQYILIFHPLCECFDIVILLWLYSDLPLAYSKTREFLKAFTHWVKDQYILGINPTRLPFPDTHTAELLRRGKTHQLFVSKSDTISKAANPVRFIKQVKFEYWAPTFINYVRVIPGRDGVSLKYIIRENDLPDLTPNKDFIDDYIHNATIMGE